MMEHPDEIQLLDYVEEALPAGERGVVAQHVGVCSECWARIRELETAQSALRASAELELPEARRQRLLGALGVGRPERRSYVSPLRLATILAPVAVVLTIVGAVVSFDGGGDDSGNGAGGAALEEGSGQDSGAGGGGESAGVPRVLIRRVRGPADRVTVLLLRRGFDAVAEGNTVVVFGEEAAPVEAALQGQPRGRVPVFLDSG